MRKIAIGILSVIAAVICIFTAACATSNAPVVGTYKLVTVTRATAGRPIRIRPNPSS